MLVVNLVVHRHTPGAITGQDAPGGPSLAQPTRGTARACYESRRSQWLMLATWTVAA